MEEKIYVHRLYKAVCDQGTMSNYLNVVEDHGVVWMANCDPGDTYDNVQPLMNACDYVPKENVIHFGRCNSKTNMGNILDKEELLVSMLMPGSMVLKKLMGCSGCKCKPIVTECWEVEDKKVLVNGVPILTEKSRLYCRNGGVITIEPVEKKN